MATKNKRTSASARADKRAKSNAKMLSENYTASVNGDNDWKKAHFDHYLDGFDVRNTDEE